MEPPVPAAGAARAVPWRMQSWHDELTAALGPLRSSTPVTGGDINSALRGELVDAAGEPRALFIKHNDDAPPGMFEAEARGLQWLRGPELRVPRVLACGHRFLALEWLDPVTPDRAAQRALGAGLAALHRRGAPHFGLDHDNFIATLPQPNTGPASGEVPDSWPAFWVEARLAPMVERALALGRGRASWRRALDRLRAGAAGSLWPDEPPARLHGDLWNGNVLFTAAGPALIDPAVYAGHREIDLAMLALFGGLTEATIEGYQAVHPLAAGWRERVPAGQLYPLLVHAVLFGGGYADRVDAILAHLTGT